MPPSTDVVADISRVGTLPANRPADRIQRIFTGLFIGSVVGPIVAILFFAPKLQLWQLLIPLVMASIIAGVGVLTHRAVLARQKKNETRRPVVARVLGTNEVREQRLVAGRGKDAGLMVPVVVSPVGGGSPFRTLVVLPPTDQGVADDPPPGMLIALDQVEEGCGDLVNCETITEEHRQYVERLERRPKLLPNTAPALPLRRGALERKPFSSALELYAGVLVGAAVTGGIMVALGS